MVNHQLSRINRAEVPRQRAAGRWGRCGVPGVINYAKRSQFLRASKCGKCFLSRRLAVRCPEMGARSEPNLGAGGRADDGRQRTEDRGRATLHEIRATSHAELRQTKPICGFLGWKWGWSDEDKANRGRFCGVEAVGPAAWEVGQRRLELGPSRRYDGRSARRGPFVVR